MRIGIGSLIFGWLLVAALPAAAQEYKPFLFSFGEGPSSEWSSELCETISAALPGHCLFVAQGGVDLSEEYQNGAFRYHVALAFNDEGNLKLSLDDWGRSQAAEGILRQEFSAIDGVGPERQVLETLEMNIIDGPLGGPTTPGLPANHWRNAFWNGLALGLATWWYLSYDDLNSEDWDFTGFYTDDPELEMRPQIEKWRGLDGWRFDDNIMVFNSPLHPMAGAGYYIMARGNNLGIWGAILTANISSFVWEAVIEHHEVMSINDSIYTGFAGIPLGEAYHQLGQFFRSGERNWVNQTMSWIFATHLQLHDLIDGTAPLYLGERDEMGWPVDTWNRFVIQPGFSAASTQGSDVVRYDGEIAGSAELKRLPDFRRQGSHSQWFTGPIGVELASSFSTGQPDAGVYTWHLYGALDFAGYYHQNLRSSPRGKVGASHFVGLGMAFKHIQHRFDGFLDRYGIMNLPGLRLDSSFFAGPVDLRFRWGVHPDFTHTDALAYPTFEAQSGRRAARTVLENHGYYYGWGLTSALGVELNMSPLKISWQWDRHWARSINAMDRYRDDEERFGPDLDGYLTLTDQHDNHRLSAMVDIPGISPLQAGLIGEWRGRQGMVDDGDERWRAELSELRGLGVVRLVY